MNFPLSPRFFFWFLLFSFQLFFVSFPAWLETYSRPSVASRVGVGAVWYVHVLLAANRVLGTVQVVPSSTLLAKTMLRLMGPVVAPVDTPYKR